MKFSEYAYQRPDIQVIDKQIHDLLEQFNAADSAEAQSHLIDEMNKVRGEFESMAEVAAIRHTIDTTDPYYEQEQDYFDETQPLYQGLVTDIYQALIHSKFRNELEAKKGKQLFKMAELTLKTFSPEVIEELQQENRLATEYDKLIASAKVVFEGEEYNLNQLTPFRVSIDRSVRKAATEAFYQFMSDNEAQFDGIYDKLVKVRSKIAQKLGFESFVELGYARMLRTDYSADHVAKFRKQVEDFLVPLTTKLLQRQQERLGLDVFTYYDEAVQYKTGNATPKGDADWIVKQAKQMYAEMSPETDEFFSFMTDHGLMDLLAKKGKASGGYCTYISKWQSPFIFANFNGTSGDIDVLTHEGGHAFQAYSSRDFATPEYQFPTYEAAEIHSMSMEFFAWPWMERFFGEDVDKYKFTHLGGALLFIPYGVAVDEFQHFVYAHPEATPTERKAAWRSLEKRYLPHLNYEGNNYLENGGFWHKQGHIFSSPFYYIDYTLAQICALQFWKKMNENHEAAWADYVHLCQQGGSRSFIELVKLAGLMSPFEEGCVEAVVGAAEDYLNQIDDKKL
ncbi:M3 family oligoendopeptidase [Pullulanibacillus pueri]|uniref:Oligoendopeptidase F n=1 Tax=Pullulanibacillus pueri TaxID=1437324 RepID=A0A8J2ZXC4_9BACL|nr:M3 family oligoendopeptidase [Pullulanibacillus pueri]MBM7684026.1 M3 family oligoendopeptidase [Pullulanibacillus pueri]GGH85048.1 oligoendopeptidase F [Pullulanibacillus pueri]